MDVLMGMMLETAAIDDAFARANSGAGGRGLDPAHAWRGAALMHKCSFSTKTGRKREMTQVQVGLRMWRRKDKGVTVDRSSLVIEE